MLKVIVVDACTQLYNGAMSQRLWVVFCTLGMSAFLMVATAWGATIVVSTDGTGAYRSIQRAIDGASYGDTILVNPGMYEESLVLISGITIRGAGSSHTVIRSSYGYQPVVKGVSVGAVVLEGISFERGISILEATVVDLQSSQVTLRSCNISSGQVGGIHVSGVSTLWFEGCTIQDNLGYGLQVVDSGNLTMKDCLVADNGSVGLYLSDTIAKIDATIVEWNEWDGLLLEGATSLNCDTVTVSNNGRWGLRASDSSQARIANSVLDTLATGNIILSDNASLALDACLLRGGISSSLGASGSSIAEMAHTQILGAVGDGVALQQQASLMMEQCVVAHCGGSGLALQTDGICQVQRVTVAYNGSHGLEFRGASLVATHNILALNDGVGLRILASASADQSLRLDYNNVWGNRAGDYAGTYRSSSDVSEAPDFINPAASDFSLSPDSPCVGSGEFGSMLGAAEHPRWAERAHLRIGFAQTEAEWGSLAASVGWTPSSNHALDGRIAWAYDWGAGRMDATTTATGIDRITARGSLVASPLQPVKVLDGQLDSAIGVRGVWDNAASRWEGWGRVGFVGAFASVEMEASYEGPTGLTQQEARLESAGFSLTGHATNLTLMNLVAGWKSTLTLGSWNSTIEIDVRLVPDLYATWTSQHALDGGFLELSASTYLKQWTTSAFSMSWHDGLSTSASLQLALRSGQFEDAQVRLNVRLASLHVSASLGANAQFGPRCRLEVLLDTSSWFAPHLNQAPVPAFSSSPREPEAEEAIEFDATASFDPDGDIDQIWWDFGDGTSDIGRVVVHRFAEPGEYAIMLTISDFDGAVTTLVERFAVAPSRTTPSASFTWAPVSEGGTRLQRALRAGDFVLLDAVDSWDPNGEILEYSWDMQSDGVFDWTSSEPRLVIDPLTAGTWPVTLRVIDDDGYSDAVMRVLIIEELKPPIADFQLSPSTPAVGDPIRFIDSSIARDGRLVSWEWDFGDGHTSRDEQPIHRYQNPGAFDVQLTVRDSEGLAATVGKTVSIPINPELVSIQQTWALLMGISDYAEVDDLSYARRDAEAIASWLLHAGVPVDHIRLLTDDGDTPSSDPIPYVDTRLATLVNVREGLGWLRQMANPDDLVIIHFSGHGYQGADDDHDERDGVDEFFVLLDTRSAAKDDTALRDDEFGRFLDRIESDHVLVFFDSCYSGGLSRSLAPGSRATSGVQDVFSDFKLEGRLILSASSETQDAFESPQLQHGVLTHFLLQGLDGAGDLNADGHITVWELFEYVHSEVPPFVLQERGEEQFPQLIGEGEARVVLTQTPVDMAVSYCPAVPFAGSSTWFQLETQANQHLLSVSWDFGDGTTATGPEINHPYEQPGSYDVTFTVQTDGAFIQTSSQTITIADWASVIGIDEDASYVLVSVGRQHGISIGDRFLAISETSDHGVASPKNALLEVVELIDEDMSACRILDDEPPPHEGSRLLPLHDSHAAPCWPVP